MKQLFFFFLKLGIIGFGGPAAHIAMMRNELVERKKWMTDEYFLSMTGIVNLIPGPNSTEMAIFIGKERGGWKGLIIAGACFILPAVIFSFILALLYVKYGNLPQIQPFLYGIKPAIIAIIITAVISLAKSAYNSSWLILLGILSFVLALIGVNELMIMIGSGALYLLIRNLYFTGSSDNQNHQKPKKNRLSVLWFTSAMIVPKTLTGISILTLFLIFLKVGAILYGSGYVLFAFLETDLVQTGILTKSQLTDAIAAGQMTPGPVFSSVTFIGYVLEGWQGALVSTAGVFIPSFLFITLFSGLFERLKSNSLFMTFLSGVIASSVALIAAVALSLGKSSVVDWRTAVIAITSLIVSFAFRKVNSAFVVVGGSLLGYLLLLIQ